MVIIDLIDSDKQIHRLQKGFIPQLGDGCVELACNLTSSIRPIFGKQQSLRNAVSKTTLERRERVMDYEQRIRHCDSLYVNLQFVHLTIISQSINEFVHS